VTIGTAVRAHGVRVSVTCVMNAISRGRHAGWQAEHDAVNGPELPGLVVSDRGVVHTCIGQLVVDYKQECPSGGPRVPGSTDTQAADELGSELVRLMRAMSRVRSSVLYAGPDGLERAAYGLLFCLVHQGPQRTSQLAENLHIEISTVSRQASALVGHGLVERAPDPDDGRAILLAPTTEGVRVFDENRRLRNERLARLTADWSAEERDQLITLLDRLTTSIERSPADDDPVGHAAGTVT